MGGCVLSLLSYLNERTLVPHVALQRVRGDPPPSTPAVAQLRLETARGIFSLTAGDGPSAGHDGSGPLHGLTQRHIEEVVSSHSGRLRSPAESVRRTGSAPVEDAGHPARTTARWRRRPARTESTLHGATDASESPRIGSMVACLPAGAHAAVPPAASHHDVSLAQERPMRDPASGSVPLDVATSTEGRTASVHRLFVPGGTAATASTQWHCCGAVLPIHHAGDRGGHTLEDLHREYVYELDGVTFKSITTLLSERAVTNADTPAVAWRPVYGSARPAQSPPSPLSPPSPSSPRERSYVTVPNTTCSVHWDAATNGGHPEAAWGRGVLRGGTSSRGLGGAIHFAPTRQLTYAQLWSRVECFGAGLVALGIPRRSLVAICDETKWEWLVSLHGALAYGMTPVAVPLEVACVDAVVRDTLGELRAVVCTQAMMSVIVDRHRWHGAYSQASACDGSDSDIESEERGLAMAESDSSGDRGVRGAVGPLPLFICTDLQPHDAARRGKTAGGPLVEAGAVFAWREVVRLGRREAVGPRRTAAAAGPHDTAVIMYTSGEARGVELTHANVRAAVREYQWRLAPVLDGVEAAHDAASGVAGRWDSLPTYLAYLPLSHIFEFVTVHVALLSGCVVGFGSPRTLRSGAGVVPHGDLVEFRPVLLAAVPRVLERLKRDVLRTLSVGFRRRVFAFAFKTRLRAQQRGMDTPLLNERVFADCVQMLGGRCRCVVSSASALHPSTHVFVEVAFGVSVVQVYGLTETCGCGAAQRYGDNQFDTVGGLVGPVELRIRPIPSILPLSRSLPCTPPPPLLGVPQRLPGDGDGSACHHRNSDSGSLSSHGRSTSTTSGGSAPCADLRHGSVVSSWETSTGNLSGGTETTAGPERPLLYAGAAVAPGRVCAMWETPRGEALLRGPTVMKGYFRQPQHTRRVLTADGWLHTGDLVELCTAGGATCTGTTPAALSVVEALGSSDREMRAFFAEAALLGPSERHLFERPRIPGTLRLMGRVKNLAKNLNGEYVALERLEAMYAQCDLCMPGGVCVLVHPQRSYLAAIVLTSLAKAKKFYFTHVLPQAGGAEADPAIAARPPVATFHWPEILRDTTVNAFAAEVLNEIASWSLCRRSERLRAVRLVYDEWCVENGARTPTGLLRRRIIEERYAGIIADLFAAEE